MSNFASDIPILSFKSPYGFFVRTRYDQYKQKHKNEAVPKEFLAKHWADTWRKMTSFERKPFDQMAANEEALLELKIARMNGDFINSLSYAKACLSRVNMVPPTVFDSTKKPDDSHAYERSSLVVRPLRRFQFSRGRVSPYGYFVKLEYEKWKASNRTAIACIPRLSREFASRWRAMSDIEKEPYYALAAEDQQRLDEEATNYYPESPSP